MEKSNQPGIFTCDVILKILFSKGSNKKFKLIFFVKVQIGPSTMCDSRQQEPGHPRAKAV
jgi:hypothetical protein